MPRRIYAQYQADPTSLQQLVTLQAATLNFNPGAHPVPKHQIHLTIIHFGIIDEVYAEIKVVAPDLNYSYYLEAVSDFVASVELSILPTIATEMLAWDLFGLHQRTLVVTTAANNELRQVHSHSLTALKNFFKNCGVNDPETFIDESQNFQFAQTLKPHITLLKNAPNAPIELLEPKNLQLQAMPILYD